MISDLDFTLCMVVCILELSSGVYASRLIYSTTFFVVGYAREQSA